MSNELGQDQIANYRRRFSADQTARVAQNAVCANDIQSLTLSRTRVQTMDDSFSVKLDDWAVTCFGSVR